MCVDPCSSQRSVYQHRPVDRVSVCICPLFDRDSVTVLLSPHADFGRTCLTSTGPVSLYTALSSSNSSSSCGNRRGGHMWAHVCSGTAASPRCRPRPADSTRFRRRCHEGVGHMHLTKWRHMFLAWSRAQNQISATTSRASVCIFDRTMRSK